SGDREARAADGGVRLVSRSAQVRVGAALRIRARRRADGGVDLRAAPRARDDSLPAHDGAAHAVKLFGALLALMLAIGAASFWAWRAAPVPLPCEDVEVVQSPSPDGRSLAEVYEKRCADSVSPHEALRAAG